MIWPFHELFRHFFAVPAAADVNGQEIGAKYF
jgi:hypothetical protein